ncbi:MAG: glycoside hydrolase family 127 protein [Bacteroidetes bacterium]|nr:glycoside hydrolase family 127 protein [Bacteroidota bacterium]
MRFSIKLFLIVVSCLTVAQAQQPSGLEPINFSKVTIRDRFWKPRIDQVTSTTIPVCIEQTEIKTPRVRNFEKVPRNAGEKHEGIFYDDSDVFKALEAIAYSLRNKPDPMLEKKADDWIDKIAAAQLPDGYLNTYYTLTDLNKRWMDMSMHEDYNGGHLIEAAVAYYEATGKRKLLDVAIKFANHFDSIFGPGKRHWVTGHEELELALVKLFRITKDRRYLELSNWLLEERGHRYAVGYTWTDWKDTAYAQDVIPVRNQREITGHAVRAMYLYTGAADVASYTGDQGYVDAMKAVWEDVVYRNMYITGGIGSSGSNEGFSVDYDLPNENAYCETCASVGMVFWNQRMNQLTGDTRYIDILERSLYNAANDGLSLDGKLFFYGNPLASDGRHKRREWFGTACCPSNIARLVSSLGNYIYASNSKTVFVNLFVASSTSIDLTSGKLSLELDSNYPWEGKVLVKVNPEKKKLRFPLAIRIPGWVLGHPVPGNSYTYLNYSGSQYALKVNGQPVAYNLENGYAVIEREWKKGDVLEADFPMEVRRVVAKPEIKEDVNRVALERGPLVYCVEHPDNDGKVMNLVLPDQIQLQTQFEASLLGGVQTISADVPVVVPTADGNGVVTEVRKMKAIPYYSWANRGQGEMQVWIPRKISGVRLSAR